ncbi:hypothetical protein [Actinacidiphila sp. bgisy160]|uniref:hypothetical protein n=1 Tax=Actinacidiphila sp. bgisy160 TaxID=3413796 RepID=UPI003D7453F9
MPAQRVGPRTILVNIETNTAPEAVVGLGLPASARTARRAMLALPAKSAGGTVYVATQCQGEGTLTVDAGRYGTSTEYCSAVPEGSMNGTAVRTPEAATRLKVTAGPGVTWAVAVAWDRHAQGPSE